MSSSELEKTGRVWARNLLSSREVDDLRNSMHLEGRPGERLSPENFALLSASIQPVIAKARDILPESRPVGAIVFNKTQGTNWAVGWHQDRIIGVAEKHDTYGFNNWTKKTGVWHCEPPIEILEHMMFARIHIDSADLQNGCLEIVNGSERQGKIEASEISSVVNAAEIEPCEAKSGDVLFGKALTVHRSKP